MDPETTFRTRTLAARRGTLLLLLVTALPLNGCRLLSSLLGGALGGRTRVGYPVGGTRVGYPVGGTRIRPLPRPRTPPSVRRTPVRPRIPGAPTPRPPTRDPRREEPTAAERGSRISGAVLLGTALTPVNPLLGGLITASGALRGSITGPADSTPEETLPEEDGTEEERSSSPERKPVDA